MSSTAHGWHDWHLLPSLTRLGYAPPGWTTPRYEVDLLRCTNASEALDWITQVHRKSWARRDPAVVAGLITALDDVLGVQTRLVAFGQQLPPLELPAIEQLVADAAERWPERVLPDW